MMLRPMMTTLPGIPVRRIGSRTKASVYVYRSRLFFDSGDRQSIQLYIPWGSKYPKVGHIYVL